MEEEEEPEQKPCLKPTLEAHQFCPICLLCQWQCNSQHSWGRSLPVALLFLMKIRQINSNLKSIGQK